MTITQIHQLKEVKNFYVWFSGEDVVIVDQDGFCVASSDTSKVGLKVLNTDRLAEIYFLVPLKCKFCHAMLVLSEEERLRKTEKETSFYKSMAELSLQQYFKAKEASQDSIDQFIAKLINKKVNLSLISQFESEAKTLGLNFEQSRIGILIHFKNFEQRLFLQNHQGVQALELIQKVKKEVAAAINGFFTKNNDLIIAYVGEGAFLVYKAINAAEEEKFKNYLKNAYNTIFGPLKTRDNGEMTVGFGNTHSSLLGLIEAYKEANLALNLGRKIKSASSAQIFHFADFKELRILAEEDNHKKIVYANEIIGSLQNPELRKTLETFFDQDLNITNTAHQLKIHPNTVLYRLKKIKDVLGLDPKIFDEATVIRIALLALKFLS